MSQIPVSHRLGARVALIALTALVVASCAGPNVKEAIPDVKRPAQPLVDRTLAVAAVTGAEPGMGVTLDNPLMRDALVAALGASGRFRAVDTAPAELELRTTILSSKMTQSRIPIVRMEVRWGLVNAYELVDVASGRTLMRETISTEAGSARSGGNDALNQCVTLAMKENLRLLIEAIDDKRPGALQ